VLEIPLKKQIYAIVMRNNGLFIVANGCIVVGLHYLGTAFSLIKHYEKTDSIIEKMYVTEHIEIIFKSILEDNMVLPLLRKFLI